MNHQSLQRIFSILYMACSHRCLAQPTAKRTVSTRNCKVHFPHRMMRRPVPCWPRRRSWRCSILRSVSILQRSSCLRRNQCHSVIISRSKWITVDLQQAYVILVNIAWMNRICFSMNPHFLLDPVWLRQSLINKSAGILFYPFHRLSSFSWTPN